LLNLIGTLNDGVSTGIKALQNVFEHLESRGKKLTHLDNEDPEDYDRQLGALS